MLFLNSSTVNFKDKHNSCRTKQSYTSKLRISIPTTVCITLPNQSNNYFLKVLNFISFMEGLQN